MTTWWKVLLPAAMLVPLLGYGLGVLTRPAQEPAQREPIVMISTNPTPTSVPSSTASTGPSTPPAPPRGRDDDDDDDDDRPDVLYPEVDDIDNDGDDRHEIDDDD